MNASVATEKLVRELHRVRRKKVQRLKTRITSGQYKIDNLELVKALFLAN